PSAGLAGDVEGSDVRARAATATGSGDHSNGVRKNLRLVSFNQIATERINGRAISNRLAINREHRFVARARRYFFYVQVVESVGDRETIDLDAKPLLECLLASAYFILEPLLVLRRSQFFL